jgi:hypothetical protein
MMGPRWLRSIDQPNGALEKKRQPLVDALASLLFLNRLSSVVNTYKILFTHPTQFHYS